MKEYKFHLYLCIIVQTGEDETTTSGLLVALTEDENLITLRNFLVELKEKELGKKVKSIVITSMTEISEELYNTLTSTKNNEDK
jgi:hypothetical protein